MIYIYFNMMLAVFIIIILVIYRSIYGIQLWFYPAIAIAIYLYNTGYNFLYLYNYLYTSKKKRICILNFGRELKRTLSQKKEEAIKHFDRTTAKNKNDQFDIKGNFFYNYQAKFIVPVDYDNLKSTSIINSNISDAYTVLLWIYYLSLISICVSFNTLYNFCNDIILAGILVATVLLLGIENKNTVLAELSNEADNYNKLITETEGELMLEIDINSQIL